MSDLGFLATVLIFLAAGVIVAPIFQRLRSSLVLGYLVAGVIIGPHVLGLVANEERTRGIAELGVVALMFTIGLELTIDRLRVVRRHVFGVGTTQVLVTALVIGVIAALAGAEPRAAILIGGALAMSSTAVVLQILAERGGLATRVGRVAFAVLLLQDMAVVPLLALVPALAGPESQLVPTVLETLAKAAVALVAIFALGRLVLRPVFRIFAIGSVPELFAAVTLLVLLGTSFATHEFGLSLGIGGFLAGILLAETEYRHQVAADIQPFRGLLLGLFFMTVGMAVDLPLIAQQVWPIVGLTVALIVVKSALLALLCRFSGLPWGASIHAGLLLGQGSEFAFVVIGSAAAVRLIDPAVGDFLVVVVALTMAATPLLAAMGQRLDRRFEVHRVNTTQHVEEETSDLKDHAIVAGFGRVGQSVSRMLNAAGQPYVAFELDANRVAAARRHGLPVYYGDASRVEVLRAAGAGRARTAVIILDNAAAAENTVSVLHHNFPAVKTFVRARDHRHRRRLEAVGAQNVVHETYELSLQLGERALRGMGVPDTLAEEIVTRHRADDYALLSDIIFPDATLVEDEETKRRRPAAKAPTGR